ncbi:Hypothetical protein SRAE_1000014400 [Strongyloides ratti]|uniref:Uncharacterized protein n=1 Tax=Strongyloides ratti TaxID=34506 RepID=A0A090MTZ0_STRRB|nr:Hypothetical protein SRAE_1000014400 [Strongyloides ratti]CEF61868.1 Hypothetical protein SRAE_1000014400 [Strongyloides ratti]
MTQVIKCIVIIAFISFFFLKKVQCDNDPSVNVANHNGLNNNNSIASSINDKANVTAIGNNNNYMRKNITPSITVAQVLLIVFSSISSSMFIMGAIFCGIYYMHKRRIISRKVLTGQDTVYSKINAS